MSELLARSVSLIGMPGGGKSTVGRQLARRLDLSFVDTDVAIEQVVGFSIRTFFEQQGEERFRDIEADTLNNLVSGHHGVIATGGGIVLREANRDILRRHTVCVYLRSSPDELFRRLRYDTKRPLLQVADPLSRLRRLFEERDSLYSDAAQFVVETGRPSIPTLVNFIIMQLELADVLPSRPHPSGHHRPE